MAMTCVICGKPAAARPASATERSAFPFCTERCRLIDLGKWLGEEYRVPAGPEGSADPEGLGAAPPEES